MVGELYVMNSFDVLIKTEASDRIPKWSTKLEEAIGCQDNEIIVHQDYDDDSWIIGMVLDEVSYTDEDNVFCKAATLLTKQGLVYCATECLFCLSDKSIKL